MLKNVTYQAEKEMGYWLLWRFVVDTLLRCCDIVLEYTETFPFFCFFFFYLKRTEPNHLLQIRMTNDIHRSLYVYVIIIIILQYYTVELDTGLDDRLIVYNIVNMTIELVTVIKWLIRNSNSGTI